MSTYIPGSMALRVNVTALDGLTSYYRDLYVHMAHDMMAPVWCIINCLLLTAVID